MFHDVQPEVQAPLYKPGVLRYCHATPAPIRVTYAFGKGWTVWSLVGPYIRSLALDPAKNLDTDKY